MIKPHIEQIGDMLITWFSHREKYSMRYSTPEEAHAEKQALDALIASAPIGAEFTSHFGLSYKLDGETFHAGKTSWFKCTPQESFPRGEDGRCLTCEGWGCCACSHGGGY